MNSPGSQINADVTTAKALAEKLRLTDTPLTGPERAALASLLHVIADRVDFRPADSFDERFAWTTVSAAFRARMRILRGDLPEEAGVL